VNCWGWAIFNTVFFSRIFLIIVDFKNVSFNRIFIVTINNVIFLVSHGQVYDCLKGFLDILRWIFTSKLKIASIESVNIVYDALLSELVFAVICELIYKHLAMGNEMPVCWNVDFVDMTVHKLKNLFKGFKSVFIILYLVKISKVVNLEFTTQIIIRIGYEILF